ncbi:MAG TPA: hypothetical protein PKK56_01390 [archaeon]|jgi:phage shock protein A|nr:hypothetical protein [archaeon]HRT02366.1 hypothetical protein [Candidatus Diapherotrites archaeon]
MATEQPSVLQDIKALQSSIQLLSQKIKYIVHNEKILGRNILILNKKISALNLQGTSEGGINQEQINEIIKKQKELETKINNLQNTIELFSKRYAKAEELKEIKYIIDNINPLEYTTVEQVKKLIKETK